MIYIVDGTGDRDDDDYNKEMANSFCNQLAKQVGETARYWRGPTLSGYEVGSIALKVANEINKLTPASGELEAEPIYLCGYSRGGHVVIDVASRIFPRKVQAMFLFDAVDRAFGSDSEKITGNVRQVYFAQRNPEFTQEAVRKTKGILENKNANVASSRNRLLSAFLGADPTAEAAARSAVNEHAIARNRSYYARSTDELSAGNFGNTGLEITPPGRLEKKQFMGSHGALGGVPWPNEVIPGDQNVVPVVRSWMWANLIKEGVLEKN